MNFYSLIKKILFQFDPEKAHTLALKSLQLAYQTGLLKYLRKTQSLKPCHIMNLSFPHCVGLAAGLDKNADYIEALAALGFGFIEIGTVTPKPQTGNPQPRLFRIIEKEALINRMGFNNKGMEYVAAQLEKTNYRGILGVNIGKNKDTPQEKAIDDYLLCFRRLWKYASYITINISSPNTPGLRDLQHGDALSELLNTLKNEQVMIAKQNKYVPLVVKISPDLNDTELQNIAQVLLTQKIDGVIATNTTVNRIDIESSSFAHETGGLSGRPLQTRSTIIVRKLHHLLQNKIPIIASGGVMDAAAIQEKMEAGASLVQVYTGFIYRGPGILKVYNISEK